MSSIQYHLWIHKSTLEEFYLKKVNNLKSAKKFIKKFSKNQLYSLGFVTLVEGFVTEVGNPPSVLNMYNDSSESMYDFARALSPINNAKG